MYEGEGHIKLYRTD
ncbi:Protein of unknown function [Bacillus mycoides]|nr:Protein of unknown function [Bacillus mycoides]